MKYCMIISLITLTGCNTDCGCSDDDRDEQEHFGPRPGGKGPIKPPRS